MDLGERAGQFRFLVRDRDSKFTSVSGQVLAGNGVRSSKRRPAHPGRTLSRSGTRERCGVSAWTTLLIHGEQHLRQVLTQYAQHYNEHRLHQSQEQRPPLHEAGQPIDMTARIKRRQVVQGLISEYRKSRLMAAGNNPCVGFGTAQGHKYGIVADGAVDLAKVCQPVAAS